MIWSFMGLCFPNICLLKGVTRHMDIWHNHDALHKEELKRRQSLLSLLLAERIQNKARKCKRESVQGEDGYTTVHQSGWYACVPKHVQCFIKEKPWCCRVPAQGNKEESCYIDSEPTVVPSKLPGKLDWHGMMQAGRQAGRHGAGEAECVPSKLKPDCWLIHWLPLIVHHEEEEENRDDCRKGNNESPCALVCCDSMCLGCVRVFSLCVGVWMYHREQGWFSPKHPQQLLRVHPSDLTYNCTNYLTTSITFFPLSCVQFTFPAFE